MGTATGLAGVFSRVAGSLMEIYPRSFLSACISLHDAGLRSFDLGAEDMGSKWMALIARDSGAWTCGTRWVLDIKRKQVPRQNHHVRRIASS